MSTYGGHRSKFELLNAPQLGVLRLLVIRVSLSASYKFSTVLGNWLSTLSTRIEDGTKSNSKVADQDTLFYHPSLLIRLRVSRGSGHHALLSRKGHNPQNVCDEQFT